MGWVGFLFCCGLTSLLLPTKIAYRKRRARRDERREDDGEWWRGASTLETAANLLPQRTNITKRTEEARLRRRSHGGGRRLKERETGDGERGLAFG